MKIAHLIVPLLLSVYGISTLNATGFLHTEGKKIVNGAGENVILRGIGTGNWLLMEGYMMKTSGIADTHSQFRAKLNETIGIEKTDSFYNVWMDNHFTRRDVDSMKVWGFNSVRVAMHYKWFTLPIEEEPVKGRHTWLEKGFVRMDSLLHWCGANQMYLILDLHGAPGGQGKDAAISDYDPAKPSLWESEENKKKTVALWKKLAQRYANEPWIGGYDLVNETNWTFPENNNVQMRRLFGEITDSIRSVDQNHIIFIEGNSFANDHSDLTPPWDNNLVYSFHKYWSTTGPNDLDWILSLQNQYNVPLWLGESGENSNTWFTDVIQLCERKNIGWSWWPVKKDGINNVIKVKTSEPYEKLIASWRGNGPALTPQETWDAVMDWARQQRIENCEIKYDVIDAMMRQPYTHETLPYKAHALLSPVFCTEYDYGKNGYAYFDAVAANYSMDFDAWNNGYQMRNDGVDIEICTDSEQGNGYNVGWTEDGEWLQYSVHADSAAMYDLHIRHASGGGGATLRMEVNGTNVTGSLVLPATGGWANWQTTTFPDVVLPAGELKLKLYFEKGGSNLSYFQFSNPRPATSVAFKLLSAETNLKGTEVLLHLNKPVDVPADGWEVTDFDLRVNQVHVPIESIRISEASGMVLALQVSGELYSDQELHISYQGKSVQSGGMELAPFLNQQVQKQMPQSRKIPGRIQAEDFYINQGFELEDCTDSGNGLNTAYANTGDYLLYKVHVTRTGYYRVIYRVATPVSQAAIKFQAGPLNIYTTLDTVQFKPTGGWQTWDAQSSDVYLEEGYYYIRLLVAQGEHNLNWFQFIFTGTPVDALSEQGGIRLYPNPATHYFTIDFSNPNITTPQVEIYDPTGRRIRTLTLVGSGNKVSVQGIKKGIYLVKIVQNQTVQVAKLKVE